MAEIVVVEPVLRLLSDVEDLMRLAKRAAEARELEEAHGYIQSAHKKLREAARVMGFKPKEHEAIHSSGPPKPEEKPITRLPRKL